MRLGVSIDAGREGFHVTAELGCLLAEPYFRALRDFVEPDPTIGLEIAVAVATTVDFAGAATAARHDMHQKLTVRLRLRVTVEEEHVLRVLCEDMRYAPLIPQNLRALCGFVERGFRLRYDGRGRAH